MNWKLYEHKVLERFREIYPNSEILYNTSIKGIKSGRSRQIDTLLINRVGRTEVKTVIDSKCFSKKISITTVESFIGFLSDVGADRGIMVTKVGYSKTAKKRAENEESDIELKILTLDELPDFVGFQAIMKFGPIDCFFEVHPKWIVNSKNPTINTLAKIYPNKYDWNAAVKKREYIYGTILPHINENHELPNDFNFEDVIKHINNALFDKYPNLEKINISHLVDLDGEPVSMHECIMDKFSEFVAVATYDEYSVIFGLVTPNKNAEVNLEALKFIVSQLKTIFTRIPGLPNLSELFFSFNDYNYVKSNKIEGETE
ncbi:MAG: hypothetical protein RL308_22 [Bacteroidota bacterium]|jgi:hypothetical protein